VYQKHKAKRISPLEMYSIVLLALNALASSPFKTFEHYPIALKDWKVVSKADENASIDMKIAIKNLNMDLLISKLYAVSDPKSDLYGKHLKKKQVDSLIAPAPESFELVKDWLSSAGITDIQISGDFITSTITIAKAQELLDTKYSVYESEGTRLIRTDSYSLPESLHDHIDFIQPTTMFSKFHEPPVQNSFLSQSSTDPALAGCTNRMTIRCLSILYNLTHTPSNQTKIGVTGYLSEYANKKDLASFMSLYSPSSTSYNFQFRSISNGINPQSLSLAGTEAALDIQYVVGLTYPSKTIFYSTGGSPPFNPDSATPTNTNEPYLDWVIYMSSLSDTVLPGVVTTSYGDNEQTVPKSFAKRVCNEFVKLGVRGTSVIFSSGDGGVAGGSGGNCQSNDGRGRMFLPVFPASCPYVTTVGGTYGIPERAVGFSSGGFSNYFERPLYQDSAVSQYLDGLDGEYDGMFNSSGRAFPDVSAYAVQYQVFVRGNLIGVSGTSASAPAFAAIISNLSDKLGRKLGFLNPWLYGGGFDSLNDITEGSNPGCGTEGFEAKKGW
jgi:tripeptidyl-peptidase I